MRDEQGFADFASARAVALRRQAYLLTGSPQRAAQVTERALADTGKRWDKLGGPVAAEEHARRAVAAAAVRARGAAPAVALTAVGTALPTDDAGEAVWRALAGMPPRRRAVLVLRYDEGLDDIAAGARLGIPAATATAEGDAGLAALRSLLRRRGAPEDLLPAALSSRSRDLALHPELQVETFAAPRSSGDGPVEVYGTPGTVAHEAVGNPAATRAAEVAGTPVVAGTHGAVEPGEARPGSGRRGSRRLLLVGGAVVAVAAAGAAVLVPVLGGDDRPAAVAADPVPAGAPTAAGELDWSARGPLAGDQDLLRTALRTWREGVPEAQRPVDAAVLYAGAPDGARTVLLQGTDRAGLTWAAEVTETAGALALTAVEPLGRAVPLVALRAGGRSRLLAPAGTGTALLAAGPDGTLRPLDLDADGLSEPVTPAAVGLPVVVTVAGSIAGSGSVLPGRLSAVTGTVELTTGTLDLGPAEVTAAWYSDGALLARRLQGPVTVAAAGPVRTSTVRVAGKPRKVEARGYEAVRGGIRYLATVVRVAGTPTCVSTAEVGPAGAEPATPPILVSRCRPARAAEGVVQVVAGGGVRSVRVRLAAAAMGKPARVVTLTGPAGDGLVGLATVAALPAAAAPAEARTANGTVVARFTVPADKGPRA